MVGLLPLLPRGPLAVSAGKRLRVPLGGPVLIGDVIRLRVKLADQPSRSCSGTGSSEPAADSGNRAPALAARRSQHFHERSDGENVIIGAIQVTARVQSV